MNATTSAIPDPTSIIDLRNLTHHSSTDGPFTVHAIAAADSDIDDDSLYDSYNSDSDQSVHVHGSDFSAVLDEFLSAQPEEYAEYYHSSSSYLACHIPTSTLKSMNNAVAIYNTLHSTEASIHPAMFTPPIPTGPTFSPTLPFADLFISTSTASEPSPHLSSAHLDKHPPAFSFIAQGCLDGCSPTNFINSELLGQHASGTLLIHQSGVHSYCCFGQQYYAYLFVYLHIQIGHHPASTLKFYLVDDLIVPVLLGDCNLLRHVLTPMASPNPYRFSGQICEHPSRPQVTLPDAVIDSGSNMCCIDADLYFRTLSDRSCDATLCTIYQSLTPYPCSTLHGYSLSVLGHAPLSINLFTRAARTADGYRDNIYAADSPITVTVLLVPNLRHHTGHSLSVTALVASSMGILQLSPAVHFCTPRQFSGPIVRGLAEHLTYSLKDFLAINNPRQDMDTALSDDFAVISTVYALPVPLVTDGFSTIDHSGWTLCTAYADPIHDDAPLAHCPTRATLPPTTTRYPENPAIHLPGSQASAAYRSLSAPPRQAVRSTRQPTLRNVSPTRIDIRDSDLLLFKPPVAPFRTPAMTTPYTNQHAPSHPRGFPDDTQRPLLVHHRSVNASPTTGPPLLASGPFKHSEPPPRKKIPLNAKSPAVSTPRPYPYSPRPPPSVTPFIPTSISPAPTADSDDSSPTLPANTSGRSPTDIGLSPSMLLEDFEFIAPMPDASGHFPSVTSSPIVIDLSDDLEPLGKLRVNMIHRPPGKHKVASLALGHTYIAPSLSALDSNQLVQCTLGIDSMAQVSCVSEAFARQHFPHGAFLPTRILLEFANSSQFQATQQVQLYIQIGFTSDGLPKFHSEICAIVTNLPYELLISCHFSTKSGTLGQWLSQFEVKTSVTRRTSRYVVEDNHIYNRQAPAPTPPPNFTPAALAPIPASLLPS